MRKKVERVLVTGACGGLGHAVTSQLAARGVTVYAADLPSAMNGHEVWPAGVVPLPMDVTDGASVARAVRKESDPLDGLVCCAGVFTGGPLVEAPERTLVHAFDTNVMGAHRLVIESFPLLVRRNGTVVLISSESARFAMPFNGPYTVSKYALEAYADCLRRELLLTGVRVAIVQPGSFRSGLLAGAGGAVGDARESSMFSPQVALVHRMLDRERNRGRGPDRVARAVLCALYARRPRVRYRVANDHMRMLLRFLPARAADALIARVMR